MNLRLPVTRCQKIDHEGGGAERSTIDVQLVDLWNDRHVLHLAPREITLDSFNETRGNGIKLNRKIGGIHLQGFAIGFIIHVLIPTAKGCRVACRGKLV